MSSHRGHEAPAIASIGIDIGKDVFHVVGFNAEGTVVLRRKDQTARARARVREAAAESRGHGGLLERALRQSDAAPTRHTPRIIPAIYVKPFAKGQKNDYNDAEAVAEAVLRPNLRVVQEKTQDQLDLQALHRVRGRLVSRRTATINQIRAFLIEQGIAVRSGAHALRQSLFTILDQRGDEISPRMHDLIVGLYEDWLWLDERIETVTRDIELISESEANCARLKTIPGVGPLISTAMVAAIGTGEAFERGRDFGAWLGLIPRQHSTGGRPILGRLSKRGSKYLRTLFIQAANVILMRPHNWEKYSFGPWLKQAEPRMHRNKLATALANKLARIAWSVLRHDRAFDARRNEPAAI